MRKTTNGFAKLSLGDFSLQLNHIVASMTGNPDFPNLQTPAQALSTEATAFAVLVQKATDRDAKAILARDAARVAITNMLHNLGTDVDAVAKGDTTLLASSGFPYTQDRKPSPDMAKPAPPQVSQGVNNGEIDCRTTTQPGMKSVNFYISTDPAALAAGDGVQWDIASYNKVKYTFSGLTSGQRYYIKVGLVGVRGQEVISDAVSFIPQ